MNATVPLVGRRILVVEDEAVIALSIEDALQELGCVVVGPVSKLDAVMRLAGEEALDAAVLDVNIRGAQVFPVAERLLARNIPFVLVTGYGDWALPEAFRHQPHLTKPVAVEDLVNQVRRLCSRPLEH
jgi:CheY-like chemotaxis protein